MTPSLRLSLSLQKKNFWLMPATVAATNLSFSWVRHSNKSFYTYVLLCKDQILPIITAEPYMVVQQGHDFSPLTIRRFLSSDNDFNNACLIGLNQLQICHKRVTHDTYSLFALLLSLLENSLPLTSKTANQPVLVNIYHSLLNLYHAKMHFY